MDFLNKKLIVLHFDEKNMHICINKIMGVKSIN
jgi:hypothetical protein